MNLVSIWRNVSYRFIQNPIRLNKFTFIGKKYESKETEYPWKKARGKNQIYQKSYKLFFFFFLLLPIFIFNVILYQCPWYSKNHKETKRVVIVKHTRVMSTSAKSLRRIRQLLGWDSTLLWYWNLFKFSVFGNKFL